MAEIILLSALVALAYTYIGYPVLLWVLARTFPRLVRREMYMPNVAVIVVVYNEVMRIGPKIETCLALEYPADKLRVLIVSDGSNDGTNAVVGEFSNDRVTLLAFPTRRGKAACVNDAVASCDEEVVVLTDARQRLDADAIKYLLENFADSSIGAVSGELMFETDGASTFGQGVDSYWRYEKFIRQQESRISSVVGVTGALYALRRESFKPIPEDTILDDLLIPMNVVMTGKRVVFEGRAKAFDVPSRDPRQEKLRKVRTLTGNYQILVSHPEFLVPFRNPIWVQLVSHKILRLLAPFCMGLMLVANFILLSSDSSFFFLFVAQLMFYALPMIGYLRPSAREWRIVKLATAFLILNWFAVLAALEFLRNRNAHLWKSESQARKGKTP